MKSCPPGATMRMTQIDVPEELRKTEVDSKVGRYK